MKRRVKWKLLIGLALGVCVLAGAAYGVYVWKSSRTATTLLEQSQRAEQEGKYEEAASSLAGYLAYVPKDNEQRIRMGRLLEQAGTPVSKRQAVGVYAKVLRSEPNRTELRRRLVDLALGTGQFAEARPHLVILLRETPEDGLLEHQLARCLESVREYTEAAEWYEKARQHAPAQVESHGRLALLLRRHLNQAERAGEVMDEMVAANPKSFQAHVARADYRRQFGTREEWAKDVAEARKLAAGETEVLLAAAELAQADNALDQARTLLRQALQRSPNHPGLYTALAGVEMQAGKPREAVACLRTGLEKTTATDDLRERLAEALLETGELAEVDELIKGLKEKGLSKAGLAYLEARVLMGKGQWREAMGILATQGSSGSSGWGGKIERAIGQCQERLGNVDQAVAAYKKAIALTQDGVSERFALASVLLAAGRADEAIAECRRITALPQAPGGGLKLLARALLLRNARLPQRQQEWGEFDDILARLAPVEPAPVDVALLRVESLAARGQVDRARAVLEAARNRQPKEAAYWIASIALSERRGKPEEVRSLLDEARKQLGSRGDLLLVEVRYWTTRNGADASAALAECERNLEKLPQVEQLAVLAALAEARFLHGEEKDAGRLWSTLAERQPNDLRTRIHLFDLALKQRDEEGMRRLVDALRRIEGEDGTFWRYAEAALLVSQARNGAREGLARAQEHLNELSRRRPRWSRTALLAASIHEVKGDPYGAVENYQKAIARGDRQLAVARRLVQLLAGQQRYAEADTVLKGLSREHLADSSLLQLAVEVSLHTRETARTLELVKQAAPPDSKNYQDHLWLGQLLAAAGKLDEAEAALRRAASLGDRLPAPWVALVECLAQSGQKEKAEAVMKDAQAKLEAGQALARCFESVGQIEKAEEQHQAALKLKPNEVDVLHNAASFYLRIGQPRKAEPELRKLLEAGTRASSAEQGWARRTLAVLLAESGDPRAWQEALTMLSRQQAAGETVEDQLARAAVLATRPGRRLDAIHVLQSVRVRQPLPEGDLFLLAQLYEREGDWPSVWEALDALADSQGNSPQYLAHYARALLRQGQIDKAARRIERLEKHDAASLLTRELKARLLKAQGKVKEATALLDEAAQATDAPLLVLAALQEELGEKGAAEAIYRKLASMPNRPENTLVLAAYLGRQGQFSRALDLLEQAWKSCPPEPVAFASAALLRTAGVGKAEFARVEQALKTAAAKESAPLALLLHLAAVHELQGHYPEAEADYRAVLKRDPDHVIALNNLAWLLAHQEGKGPEAIDLLRRALGKAGPLPELLDTRAVVLVNSGKSESAIQDLEQALATAPTATRYFHLARARLATEDRTGAGKALRSARSAGLKVERLHPLEHNSYNELVKELEQQ